MRQRNHSHRPRTTPPPTPAQIDTFMDGPVNTERIRRLLETVYERLQVDILKQPKPTEDEDEKLYTALQNCYFEDGHSNAEGNRTTKRLTKRERLIRVVGACFNRVAFLDSNPADIVGDLELLDALKDVIEGYADGWTITPECEIAFD